MVQFNFSHVLPGVVWSTVAFPEKNILLLEVRDSKEKRVSFWALNYQTNEFLWREKTLDEPWWVNLSGVHDGVILFTIYVDTQNPDKKAAMAYSLDSFELLWWHNDFSISSVGKTITGFTSKLGLKEAFLDVFTGKEVGGSVNPAVPNGNVIRPLQYIENTPYFDTVRRFLADRLNFSAVHSLEYLEAHSHIIISCYTGQEILANYLIVLSLEGVVMMKEIMEESVQGIGLGTFFVIERSLFFVKNKAALVSYTLI
jgi:hypothetical protein